MKKILMLVNTYFQLIVAINLKLSEFLNDDVDLIITDRTVDYKKIANNVIKTNLFSKVYYGNTNHIWEEKNTVLKILDLLYIRKNDLIKKSVEMTDFKYDIFLFYNYDIFSYTLYNKLKKTNKHIIANRFEEGFGSYLYKDKKLKGDGLRKLLRKIRIYYNLEDDIKEYYLFNPDLMVYPEKAKLKKMKNIDRNNKELVKYLNDIFEYNSNNNEYKQKYIFFEESFFCDKKGIEDFDLIMKIAEIVGKENLMVKIHPRNKIDRFSEHGIITNKNIGVPWEIVQMNNDFSDKIFITISSGSVLASRLYFNDNIETYLLFNCTQKMSDMVTPKFFKYLEKVKQKFTMENFIMPKNSKNFYELLEGERK